MRLVLLAMAVVASIWTPAIRQVQPGGPANVALKTGTLAQFAPTTSTQLASVLTDETGSGVVAYSISPAFTTPSLGVASATTINKVTVTTPASGSTLTIADGKTLTVSNTTTLTGTDGSALNIGTGGTLGTNAFSSTVYLVQGATPSITSGFGTNPAIDAGYASSFIVTIGSGGTATAGVVGLPTAAVGWVCQVENLDNPIPTTSLTVASAYSTSSVTFTNYTIATGVALAWPAGNHLRASCFPH